MKVKGSIPRKLLSPRQTNPENNHMDPVAGIINKLLVATPFVVVTTLGLHAHHAAEPFKFVANTRARDMLVSNYIPVVRESENASKGKLLIPEKKAMELASHWISGAKSGLLRPLTPIAVDDSSREGVKGQIVRSCMKVAESLNLSASEHLRAGAYGLAIRDTLKSMETVQTVKFFDFASLGESCMVERRSLLLIQNSLGKLPADEQVKVKEEVATLGATTVKLKPMELEVHIFALDRGASEPLDHFLTMTEKANSDELLKLSRIQPSVGDDTGLSDLISDYRLGLSSVSDTNRMVKEISA